MNFEIYLKNRTIILFLLFTILIGIIVRTYSIGDRPFSIDEYYTASSIDLILEKGVPEFDTGGYYVRGLLHQYLTASAAKIFGKSDIVYRLPSVIFGILSIILTYFYSRRYLDVPLALAVVFTLTLSSWHIEFSQFIRMYAALQCIALLFLIAWHAAYIEGRWNLRYLPHLIALIGALVHALIVLLLPFLLIPLLFAKDNRHLQNLPQRLMFGAVGLITGLLCFSYSRVGFRNYGINPRFPENYIPQNFRLPSSQPDPLLAIDSVKYFGIGAAVLIACLVVFSIWIARNRFSGIKEIDYFLIPNIIFSLFHNIFVSAVLITFMFFRYIVGGKEKISSARLLLLLSSIVINLLWLIYAWFNRGEWVPSVAAVHGDVPTLYVWKAWLKTFAGWPDLAFTIKPWVRDLPVLSLLLFASLAFIALLRVREPLTNFVRSPIFIVLYLFFCIGIFEPLYATTRYIFFIYPVILCTIALAASEGVKRIAARRSSWNAQKVQLVSVLLYVAAFAVTFDFNPRHWFLVGDDSVVFRTNEFERFGEVWYQRWDNLSPAEFLNDNVSDDGSNIAVVLNMPPVLYYLNRDAYVYYPRIGDKFPIESRERGTVHLWSNRPLLSTPAELRKASEGVRQVWLVRLVNSNHLRNPEEVWGERFAQLQQRYISRDGRIEVVEIELLERLQDNRNR